MKYKILYATTPDKLTEYVQEALDDGWSLLGDPNYGVHSDYDTWFQAMIYYHPEMLEMTITTPLAEAINSPAKFMENLMNVGPG
jgi:hypothetical protein